MDYGYINARVRGMHSILLDRKAYDSLILKQDILSIITELENTPYRKEVEEASVLYSGVLAVEYALRRNLIRTYQKILSLVKGRLAEKYILIFLNKWDVQNIKTILRGKNIHISQDEILECLIPAGELDEVTITELLKQPDVRAVVDLLATWEQPYALPLTECLDDYAENRDLSILEYAIDQYYYRNALDTVSGRSEEARIIKSLIMAEIDVVNIKNLIRVINENVEYEDAKRLFLEGGSHILEDKFSSMYETGNIADAMKQLDGTPYYFLSHLPDDVFKSGQISSFEKELDKFIIKNGTRTYDGDPLSISIVIGYLWAKYSEIINLRIIARCKYAEVSDEELEEELINV
ncbi:MAG TPA: ATP synthase A1 subunit C [Methanoregulaceae archaeon]|nr:ATP synthase A1 subunit C [Methanoregulaceae archaeon]